MDSCSASTRDDFRSDLLLAQEEARAAVVPKRAAAQDNHWDLWCTFTASLGLDPYLPDVSDKVPYLQVFAVRLRRGDIAPSGQPLKSRSVEDYLRSVGQEMASLGAPDPHLDQQGKTTGCLHRLLKAYA